MVTRGKIVAGAMQVLAEAGVAGLTHRAVARAAGVSLAATTHHFDAKTDIIEEASRALLDAYLGGFVRMKGRLETGEEVRLASLDDLVLRVVLNALGRDRTRSLAWCELILHGGRSPGGRATAQSWYEQLDAIWYGIARLFDAAATQRQASAAIDLAIGTTFFLHPLGLDRATAEALLAGRLDIEVLLGQVSGSGARAPDAAQDDGDMKKRHAETRQKVVQAAIDVIVEDGAAGISYARVAEVAGMVRSGPSYYFPTIDGLLEAAQMALFERAKARYRSGLAAHGTGDLEENRLLDLTTAVYFREALEFGRENIGYYSVWMNAAQNPSLRPAVASSLLDLHRAWLRRLAATGATTPDPVVAFRIQALFIGKLIRAIVAPAGIADLARARDDFAAVLHRQPGGTASS